MSLSKLGEFSFMPNKKLKEIINRILQVIVPDKIILFGSRARGNAKKDSDYDLLVIKSGIENRILIEQDIYEKFIGIDESIDILVRKPEDIDQDKNNSGSLISRALNEGIIIYG